MARPELVASIDFMVFQNTIVSHWPSFAQAAPPGHVSPLRPLVTGAGRSTANLILPSTISHWFFWAGSLKFLKVKVNSRQAALRVQSLTIIWRFTSSCAPICICRQPPGLSPFVRNETQDWLCHTAHVYEVTRSCLPHSIIIVMNHHASLNHISDYIFY